MTVLNLERLPEAIKEDIEVQSLDLLRLFRDHLVVIGGWAVRAWTHHIALRSTIDVDAVADPNGLRTLFRVAKDLNLGVDKDMDWGVKFYRKYVPVSAEAREAAEGLEEVLDEAEIRVEVSEPRIREKRTDHYFDFHPETAVRKATVTRGGTASLECRVANVHELAANKAGLPADYKNIFDLALLLTQCDLEEVIRLIVSTDDWRAMVSRRCPRFINKVQQADHLAHTLLTASDINIDGFVGSIVRIRDAIS